MNSTVTLGDTNKRDEPGTFRFVQEVFCTAGVGVPANPRLPTLKNAEESLSVQNELKLKSRHYFELIASKQLDQAVTYVATTSMGASEAKWQKDKLSFQLRVGERIQIAIVKMTVYDNPLCAPKLGLYVVGDYNNSYSDMPVHCGYLM